MSATEEERHTVRPVHMLIFGGKASLLRLRRSVSDAVNPMVSRHRSDPLALGACLAEVISPLYTEANPNERALQLGKVLNLRIGARALDAVRLKAGDVFSFWAQVGRPIRARRFVEGRELRQGCLLPTVAGGLWLSRAEQKPATRRRKIRPVVLRLGEPPEGLARRGSPKRLA